MCAAVTLLLYSTIITRRISSTEFQKLLKIEGALHYILQSRLDFIR